MRDVVRRTCLGNPGSTLNLIARRLQSLRVIGFELTEPEEPRFRIRRDPFELLTERLVKLRAGTLALELDDHRFTLRTISPNMKYDGTPFAGMNRVAPPREVKSRDLLRERDADEGSVWRAGGGYDWMPEASRKLVVNRCFSHVLDARRGEG